MSRREEILREMGLTPIWRLRRSAGDSLGEDRSAGDPPAEQSPLVQGVHDRGFLPHLKAQGGIYFVTFRLANSLPQDVLRQLEELTAEQRSMRVDEYLDAGFGENWLARPEIAEALRKVLMHFDGKRYRLHAWVIMPNHVHLLIEPLEQRSLTEVMQGIKSVSAHESNKLLKREGPFWQPESYDHLVRDQEDFDRCRNYIPQNPVKAKLARTPQDYVFSSSFHAFENQSAGGSPALRESPALPDDRRAAIMRMDWPELKAKVASCVDCPLHAKRNKTVLGVGDENADWLFVGEGPGADEDAQGEPFVGQAGKLLDNMLAAIKLKRGRDAYIANVVKCLRYNALVQLGDRRWERIGRLVASRYSGEVMSVDAAGALVPRRVVGWHSSPLAERRVFRLSYASAKVAGASKAGIQLTGDHLVLTGRGWVAVQELVKGDTIATGQGLSEASFDVVCGTLLGDGHIAPFVPPSMRYKLHPQVAQEVPFDPVRLKSGPAHVCYDEVDVEEIVHRGSDQTFFCLDVEETHNFVTSGGVVHNCRPPGNRNPEPAEALACEPYLHRQIELIKPKLIIALGKVAAVNLLSREASIASLRGRLHQYLGIPLIVTYHPAYLLRSLGDKAKAWADLCFAVDTMKDLQKQPSAPS